MNLFKPATPGFLTTLAATIILAIVSFSVPHFKTIYFLKAGISQSGVNGTVTFGVLGYCMDFNNQVTCSKATVGWEFNPNALLGNDLPIQIPNVVVKWITYALVLHIVALGLAGVSAVFGLLAHVREMTMSCFSSCISGMAAAVCLIAFIFDLVLFFAVRARVNKVEGGSATIGNGLWLTLAAWVLLFFSGCMFAFGRCCVSRGGGRSRSKRDRDDEDGGKFNRESERMRLDAVKAEADRKALAAAGGRERGLPAFYEYERTPLRRDEPQYYEEEVEVVAPYSDARPAGPSRDASYASRSSAGRRDVGGSVRTNRAYEPGAPGTRAIDDYFNNTAPVATAAVAATAVAANTYPPQRQPSQNQPAQAQNYGSQPQRYQSPSYDAYAQQSTAPQRFQSPSHDPYPQPSHFVDPYAQAQTQAPQGRRVDPYLAVAGYAGAGGYGHQGEASYNSTAPHQQYASDPLGSHYNPAGASMSPPQPTHYQNQSDPGYGQQAYVQGYGQHQQQQQQQGYEDYRREPSYDQPQGYEYGGYNQQQAYDAPPSSYNNQQPSGPPLVQPQPQHFIQPSAYEPTRQATIPQPQSYELHDSPNPHSFVASPHPIESPSYSPRPGTNVNTAVGGTGAPRGPRSAGAGPSQPPAQHWSGGTEEGGSEAPPPQYDAMPAAGATAYPVEKR